MFSDPTNPEAGPPIEIPVVEWRARVKKAFTDITTSEQYNSKTNLVCPTRLATSAEIEGVIQGRFRLSRVPQTLIRAMFSGDVIPTIELWITRDFWFARGCFHLAEFETSVPCNDVVDYVATIRSQGAFDLNDEAAALAEPA